MIMYTHTFSLFLLLNCLSAFVIVVSCTSIDLNRSPPPSPSTESGHGVEESENSVKISSQDVPKSNKRKATIQLTEENLEDPQPNQKHAKIDYPANMTSREKKKIRNKIWYAGLVCIL